MRPDVWPAMVAVAIAAVAIAVAIRFALRDRARAARSRRAKAPRPQVAAAAFGANMAWLAIRGTPPESVIDALDLRDPRRSAWREAIRDLYGDGPPFRKVFVTPEVDGWVLAVGLGLGPGEDRVLWRTRLSHLSLRLGGARVDGYATRREVGLCAWARAEGGFPVRAYTFLGELGEILENFGELTPEEQAFGHRLGDEGDVIALAARWSVDPLHAADREREVGPGWIAERR